MLAQAFGPISESRARHQGYAAPAAGYGHYSDGWIFDTALAAHLLSPTDSSYDLRRLSKVYCGFTLNTGEDENGQLSSPDGAQELRGSSRRRWRLHFKGKARADADGIRDGQLFYGIELPLCRVLAEMEHTGFCIDKKALRDFGDMLSVKITGLEEKIFKLAGEPFNINSPKQLGTILFDKLMLPAPKKTKTGYSTSIEVLEYLYGKHPIIGLLMEYRELSKLKSTYADGLLKVISADGRIHTNFQMTVTPPAGCPQQNRTSRIYPSVKRRAASCAGCLLQKTGTYWSTPTIHRLSCGSWLTLPTTR